MRSAIVSFLVGVFLALVVLVGPGGVRLSGEVPAKFEVGQNYRVVDLSLHCGYSEVSRLEIGSELWEFSEGGSADSIFVTGVLRRLSADRAVFVADNVSHPLVRVTEYHSICI